MADIKYKWAKGPGSVGIDEKLELPQFKVVGHKQHEKVIALSTGKATSLLPVLDQEPLRAVLERAPENVLSLS